MQVTETLAEGLKHEFQISVPAADLDAKADARLVDLKGKVRINGFRPGKVPVSHLKKVYGRSVMAETIDQTIRDTNTQIFSERGFRLATEPKITMPTEEKEVEQLLSGQSDLTYTVSIEVVPTIKLADFKTFALEKPVADVSDAEVDEATQRIADQNRSYGPKGEGAKAETGDRVTINFKGSIDGVPFEGGTGENIQVVIGAGQFIPGFEEQLIGIGAGEARTLKVSQELRKREARRQAGRVRDHRKRHRKAAADRDQRRTRQGARARIARQAEGGGARTSRRRIRGRYAPARQARVARPSRREPSVRSAVFPD
jgi:trigger factor